MSVSVSDDDGGVDAEVFDVTIANTVSGNDVVVTPPDATTGAPSPVTMTFENITSGGATTVTSGAVGGGSRPPPPANFRMGSPPTYYDIQTTAEYDGTITVCLSYAGVRYGNESNLRLLHGETDAAGNVRWVDVTTSVDVVNDIICGTVTSLSPFLAAEPNMSPVVQSIALPSNPVPVGTTVSVTATFTDANTGDVHTASIDWKAAVTAGAVTEGTNAGTVAGQMTFAQPGVYSVKVTVSDGLASGTRSSDLDIPAYIVVYDPAAGFVTGGGWIHSPQGAYAPDFSASGEASFGFSARYKQGGSVPDGNTEFHFRAGNLVFRSTSYDWLVVGGSKARFRGQGTVNGAGRYSFVLTAVDDPGGTDQFRIKIWNRVTGVVLYDNRMGEADDSDMATAIGGGSIVIHRR